MKTTVKFKTKRIWMVGAILLLFAIGIGGMFLRMNYTPTNLDLSTTRTTENGQFVLSYETPGNQAPVNQIHEWTLYVRTPDGIPVENASITVDGDMPQHGHGLPTQPRVTAYLGEGKYRVEGMKFQMTGWWVVDFVITDGETTDTVRFNMILK